MVIVPDPVRCRSDIAAIEILHLVNSIAIISSSNVVSCSHIPCSNANIHFLCCEFDSLTSSPLLTSTLGALCWRIGYLGCGSMSERCIISFHVSSLDSLASQFWSLWQGDDPPPFSAGLGTSLGGQSLKD